MEIGAATLTAYFAGDLSTLTVDRGVAARHRRGTSRQMHAYFRRIAPPGSTVFTGGLAWIDAKGRSRVSSSLPRIAKPIDVSDRVYFKQVMATNAPYVSAGLTSKRTNLRVVVIAVPTHDAGGAINGVLVGAIKVKPAAPSRSSIALGLQRPRDPRPCRQRDHHRSRAAGERGARRATRAARERRDLGHPRARRRVRARGRLGLLAEGRAGSSRSTGPARRSSRRRGAR